MHGAGAHEPVWSDHDGYDAAVLCLHRACHGDSRRGWRHGCSAVSTGLDPYAALPGIERL